MIVLLMFLLDTQTWLERQYQAHIRFLAADTLEGREATYAGQQTAAAYIAAHLRRVNVPPAFPGTDEPYFQKFSLEVSELRTWEMISLVSGKGERVQLKHGENMDLIPIEITEVDTRATLVFAGYGLDYPAYSDYHGIDPRGKWVVMMNGRPRGNGALFGEGTVVEDDELFAKYATATARGAAGIILLERARGEEFSGEMLAGKEMALPGNNKGSTSMTPLVVVYEEAWPKLFGRYHGRFQKALGRIETEEKPSGFLLRGRTLDLRVRTRTSIRPTENVIAVIPGNDPHMGDEYVAVSAHYDHVGRIAGQVYNGADDNASGTATLMLLAERFAAKRFRRGIIFLFLSAEEQGLLGSRYFVENTNVPLEKIVANINFDMIGRGHDGSMGVIPSANGDVSTLNDLLKRINSEKGHGLKLKEDLDRLHHRSDHYNFVLKDIPAIFFLADLHDDYHTPKDDWQLLSYERLASNLLFFEDFLTAVLEADERPRFTAPGRNQEKDD